MLLPPLLMVVLAWRAAQRCMGPAVQCPLAWRGLARDSQPHDRAAALLCPQLPALLPAGVAEAIFESVLPRNAGDLLPQTPAGLLVSVADK